MLVSIELYVYNHWEVKKNYMFFLYVSKVRTPYHQYQGNTLGVVIATLITYLKIRQPLNQVFKMGFKGQFGLNIF